MLDVKVEAFRAKAHEVHQGDGKSIEFGKAAEEMNRLWLEMDEFQREQAIKGYEWMWEPPSEVSGH